MIESRRSYFLSLCGLNLVKAICLLLLILYYIIHLAPDEAQYWCWSQALDWGYYSKPPAIAWQIALTTQLFGNTELGVRFGAVILGFLLPLIIFFTATYSGLSAKHSFWAGVVMAFSPLGIVFSTAATTDIGVIVFLTLAVTVVLKGIYEKKEPSFLLVGVCIFIGALYKWVAYLFWPFALFLVIFYRSWRKKNLFLGIFISLLALFPTLYWNASHDFATFKHVFSTLSHATGHMSSKKHGNVLDFIISQIGLLSPIYFALLICALGKLFQRKMNLQLAFCALFPLALLAFILLAIFNKIQPNWALYLYPPGMVLISWFALDFLKRGELWLKWGTFLSVLMTACALAIPWIQRECLLPIPYKWSPFRQNVGWNHLSQALLDKGYDVNHHFLFADKYQTASLLSFYGPLQKRAYFLNVNLQRKNQFSYWPGMEENEVGKDGVFVVIENTQKNALSWYEHHYVEKLTPFFEQVTYLGAYPLFTVCGEDVKYAMMFLGKTYNGTLPKLVSKY